MSNFLSLNTLRQLSWNRRYRYLKIDTYIICFLFFVQNMLQKIKRFSKMVGGNSDLLTFSIENQILEGWDVACLKEQILKVTLECQSVSAI